MASMKMFLVLVVVLAVSPALSVATEFMVGDDAGWNINFNQSWAVGKDFRVGDTLVFMYNKTKHNVYKVDKAGFANCTVPSNGVMDTGNDRITLAGPGKKWYICGVGEHCAKLGMKLVIDVKPVEGAAPTSPPATPGGPGASNSANGIANSGFAAVAAVVALGFVMIMA